jgi:hypothetical protein
VYPNWVDARDAAREAAEMTDAARGVVHADSRWWYWVAALPAVVALWTASALWVLLGVALEFGGGGGVGSRGLVLLPAVALGGPALVVFLLLPVALWRDGEALLRAGAGWPEFPVVWAAIAGLVDLVLVAGLAVLVGVDRTIGFIVVLVAVLLGTGLALTYLRARVQHAWTPTSLRELRHELRPN